MTSHSRRGRCPIALAAYRLIGPPTAAAIANSLPGFYRIKDTAGSLATTFRFANVNCNPATGRLPGHQRAG